MTFCVNVAIYKVKGTEKMTLDVTNHLSLNRKSATNFALLLQGA